MIMNSEIERKMKQSLTLILLTISARRLTLPSSSSDIHRYPGRSDRESVSWLVHRRNPSEIKRLRVLFSRLISTERLLLLRIVDTPNGMIS